MEENPDTLINLDKSVKSLKGVKILVAEDEESSFRVVDKIFNEQEINTIRAVNGKEAVEIVQANLDIQLILMDIKMPVMNGIEATRAIKKIRPSLPVIATSAFAMPGDKKVFKDAGCEDYIPKPVKAELLLTIIRNYLV